MFRNKQKILLILAFSLIMPWSLNSSEVERLWGISKSDLIKKLKVDTYETFRPSEKPLYKNRIIDFFSSMSSDDKTDIFIIRVTGKPEVDYCFFNQKLFSVSEEWGEIDKARASGIIKSFETEYPGTPATESADGLYSFKKNRTKVLIQKKDISASSSKIRVFYYSTDLFTMLMREQ